MHGGNGQPSAACPVVSLWLECAASGTKRRSNGWPSSCGARAWPVGEGISPCLESQTSHGRRPRWPSSLTGASGTDTAAERTSRQRRTPRHGGRRSAEIKPGIDESIGLFVAKVGAWYASGSARWRELRSAASRESGVELRRGSRHKLSVHRVRRRRGRPRLASVPRR